MFEPTEVFEKMNLEEALKRQQELGRALEQQLAAERAKVARLEEELEQKKVAAFVGTRSPTDEPAMLKTQLASLSSKLADMRRRNEDLEDEKEVLQEEVYSLQARLNECSDVQDMLDQLEAQVQISERASLKHLKLLKEHKKLQKKFDELERQYKILAEIDNI